MSGPASIRTTMAIVTVVVTVLAVIVSAGLVTLTTILHRSTVSSTASVESVRIAEEAEIDLLRHERARDALIRRELESSLRHKLTEANRFVTTESEARALAEAESQVERFILVSRDPQRSAAERAARQDAAYRALESLVRINLAQAKAAQQNAARWDYLGNFVGVSVGALVVVVAGVLLFWLRRRAFERVLVLASAMERFGRGEHDTRAAETGPRELRDMCRRFNEMASAVAAQRQAQIAFLGGVAHDLRNPLAALQMSVGLLGGDQPLPSEDRIRQTVGRISRQITRMERMLGDFLDVAKIEAGELGLQLDTHDARALVAEVVDLFVDAGQDHRLEVQLPEEELLVRCDALRVEQVIANFISNAIKYSPAGTIVEVILEARGGELALSVTDRGVGISARDKARIFEPFRRVGLSRETVPGVGLGLFVVRTIVAAHGGRIEVESEPGRGSTFRFFLPLGLGR